MVCDEKTNQSYSANTPSLPVDGIYGNSDIIHKHTNTRPSVIDESMGLPGDGHDNLETDKQSPFNQTELDLETVTNSISYDFEKGINSKTKYEYTLYRPILNNFYI